MTHHNRGDDLYTKYRTEYNLIKELRTRGPSRDGVAARKMRALWIGLYVNLYQLPVQLLQFIVGLETMSGVKWSLLVIM